MSFSAQSCRIDDLTPDNQLPCHVDVLRLDLIHPVVSGNKWFKLKEYLNDARNTHKSILLTFGGPFSNHIVATAAAAQMQGMRSIGIIRGEEPRVLSHTLTTAKLYGMQLYFTKREEYKNKTIPSAVFDQNTLGELYVIPEGGYGEKGMKGAKDILHQAQTSSYTHILAAVGTGTTLAGIIAAAQPHQKVIGIPVLKNAFSLQQEIEELLRGQAHCPFELLWDYHFGGYAKHTDILLGFMNEFYIKTTVPTDFVYTGKAFYGAFDLLKKGYFSPTDKLLLVHTGGMQGNLSLPKGTLIFA